MPWELIQNKGVNERDAAYLHILRFGLTCLRDAAGGGNAAYCAVEADHLHNLPSLVGEANECRHDYYFDRERPLYLERVDRSVPGIEFTLARYAEIWQRLSELRGGASTGDTLDCIGE
jgi:hypothetical protein